jgi:hypothetical protein
VIADLSFHHVAYRVVKCGFTLEADKADYGYDGFITTFDQNGYVDNAYILIQLKATDKIKLSLDGTTVLFSLAKKDINLWQDEFVPVYLIVFDSRLEIAYWIYFQKYLESNDVRASNIITKSLRVRISRKNVVNAKAILGWRADKERVLAEIGRVTHA